MIKVLLLNPTIPPRALPILNGIAEDASIDLTVFFYSISAKNRRWVLNEKNMRFKYKILKSFDIGFYGKDYFPFTISTDFLQRLVKLNPDVVIVPGWTDLNSFIGAIYCKFFDRKLVLRSESTKYEKSWRRTVFMPLTKFMVHSANAYTASGTRARDYLIALGALKEKIFIGYSTIDVKRFSKDSKLSLKQKIELRKKLGIGRNDKVIMFNGQLILRKGVYDLLVAFKRIQKKYPEAKLLMVGYGQELGGIRKYINKNMLKKKVILTGFIENTLLPKYYAISDIFTLPSREETWGIVVNEAMACGLPVVVGDRVGSSEDLVKDGKNGYVFESGNSKDLFMSLLKLVRSEKRRILFGIYSQKYITKFNLDNIEKSLVKAINV